MTVDQEYIKNVKGDCRKSDNWGDVPVMLDEGGTMPNRAYPLDAGADIYATKDFAIWPHSTETIDAKVHVQLPNSTLGMIAGRSSMNKRGIIATIGIVDAGYTGSIGVTLFNSTEEKQFFKAGDRIAQLLIIPCATPKFVLVDRLKDTERGNDGFGSTGR